MIHPNLTPEQIRKKQEEEQRKNKIAQSQASATPVQPRGPMSGPAVSRQQSPLMQIGQMLGKQALGSALGPLGGLLGGLFNVGGKVDYAKEAQKRVQAQNAAIKAGAQGQQIAPATRTLFNEAGKQIGEVPGDVIKGYGGRAKQQAAPQQDPFAGIAAKIAADKAAGKPVDYNALAALQHARSQTNTEARNMAMREFMKKYPQFAKPGGSQGVVLRKRNMGGPISGYARGGEVMEEKDRKRMERKRQRAAAKQRGEYEVADWFPEEGHYDPVSPLGRGWKWKNEPNERLKNVLVDKGGFSAAYEGAPQAIQAANYEGRYSPTDHPFIIKGADTTGKYNWLEQFGGGHSASPENLRWANEDDYFRTFEKTIPEWEKLSKQIDAFEKGFNMGGPISANPYGYNEGGQAQATPIKKVMDQDKLEAQQEMDVIKEDQAEKAFLAGERRKEEMHALQMKQKEEAHALQMKLKKESATMKAPLAKK